MFQDHYLLDDDVMLLDDDVMQAQIIIIINVLFSKTKYFVYSFSYFFVYYYRKRKQKNPVNRPVGRLLYVVVV